MKRFENQLQDTLADHVRLARWCQTHDLNDRRDAHLQRALMHDPENRLVRRQLRHVNLDGQWYTPKQIQKQEQELDAAQQRWRDWREPVKQIAKQLRSRSKRIRESGRKQLHRISDPRSVTALEVILAQDGEPLARQAIETIHRFPEREATESLARIALFSPSEVVREQSLNLLAERNRYDVVPDLIRQLVSPISTRYLITPASNGNVLYQYVLFQQDLEKDYIRHFNLRMLQGPRNANLLWQSRLTGEANQRAMMAENGIRQLNDVIQQRNAAIQYALERVTLASPGHSPEDWWRWWYDENEIYVAKRPVSYTRIDETAVTASPQVQAAGECLVAGTPILTERGLRPVESLQVGDRVLSQDQDSGQREYRAVLYPTTRPATPTFLIQLDNETIRASGGHLFWVRGQGWTKTRSLQAGMSLRTAEEYATPIRQIATGEPVPLFNLVVDQNANYFIGTSAVLSHDSTILANGAPSVEQNVK